MKKPDITQRLRDVANIGVGARDIQTPEWIRLDPMWGNNQWAKAISALCEEARYTIILLRVLLAAVIPWAVLAVMVVTR